MNERQQRRLRIIIRRMGFRLGARTQEDRNAWMDALLFTAQRFIENAPLAP